MRKGYELETRNNFNLLIWFGAVGMVSLVILYMDFGVCRLIVHLVPKINNGNLVSRKKEGRLR